MRKFRFVGSTKDASGYEGKRPCTGNIYREGDEIGWMNVEYWALKASDKIKSEWEEVFESGSTQDGDNNWISLNIITHKEGKEVTIGFNTNDLEEFKKFVNNLV